MSLHEKLREWWSHRERERERDTEKERERERYREREIQREKEREREIERMGKRLVVSLRFTQTVQHWPQILV